MSIYTAPYYIGSPVWMQEAMLSLRGWARGSLREGPAFRRELAEVDRTQWLDEAAMDALQLDRVRRTLQHAFDHVPFYRDRMRAVGFEPDDLHTLADLGRLPELSKRDVFDAGERMLSDVHHGLRFKGSTSGTTGLSMTGWRDLHTINRENAFIWRQMGWAGMKPGDRRVWLRGDKVVPSAQKAPPFWRHNRGEHQLMMSAYHLSEATAGAYIDALEAYDPVVLQGYPSAVLLMARYLVSKGRRYRGRSLRSVVTSSETVTDEHRRLVDEAFGVRIFDWYGCFERMVAIGTCEQGRYHLMSDYSYTELHPQPDGSCEVVGTSFDNLLMPWIRYRLGDAIVPAPQGTLCTCGRAFPVIDHIVGRIEDYILTPDGRHVFMMSNVLDYLPNLLEGQIRQDSRDEVKLLVVMAPGAVLDEPGARAAVRAQLGDDMRITIQRVERIPRTSNGKLQVVVRSLPATEVLPPKPMAKDV
jgi:phenylacetate-CoA ligase